MEALFSIQLFHFLVRYLRLDKSNLIISQKVKNEQTQNCFVKSKPL